MGRAAGTGDDPGSWAAPVGDEVGPGGLGLGAVSVGTAEGGVADSGGEVGPGVVIGLGPGVGGVGVPTHAARMTPRRRDAARRLAFICRRRWCCGLSRR